MYRYNMAIHYNTSLAHYSYLLCICISFPNSGDLLDAMLTEIMNFNRLF